MTFFPATSAASQTLPIFKQEQIVNTKNKSCLTQMYQENITQNLCSMDDTSSNNSCQSLQPIETLNFARWNNLNGIISS